MVDERKNSILRAGTDRVCTHRRHDARGPIGCKRCTITNLQPRGCHHYHGWISNATQASRVFSKVSHLISCHPPHTCYENKLLLGLSRRFSYSHLLFRPTLAFPVEGVGVPGVALLGLSPNKPLLMSLAP